VFCCRKCRSPLFRPEHVMVSQAAGSTSLKRPRMHLKLPGIPVGASMPIAGHWQGCVTIQLFLSARGAEMDGRREQGYGEQALLPN
jgi:hypothetical protein